MVKVVTSVGNLIKILKKNFETNILWKKFCDNYFCGTNIFWDQMFLGRNFLGVMVLGTKFLTAIFGTKSILEQHFFQTKYFKTKLRQTVSAWVSPNSTPACLCNLMIRGGVIIKKGENFCATFKKGMTPPPHRIFQTFLSFRLVWKILTPLSDQIQTFLNLRTYWWQKTPPDWHF